MTATLTKPSRQAAANCDRFEALIVGAIFSTYYRGRAGYVLREVYAKVDADRVQVITDSRIWPFACCEASRSGVILVPYGDGPFSCDVRNHVG